MPFGTRSFRILGASGMLHATALWDITHRCLVARIPLEKWQTKVRNITPSRDVAEAASMPAAVPIEVRFEVEAPDELDKPDLVTPSELAEASEMLQEAAIPVVDGVYHSTFGEDLTRLPFFTLRKRAKDAGVADADKLDKPSLIAAILAKREQVTA